MRVHRVGVCGTDLHAFRGAQPFFTYPRILGHELGVEVVAVGPEVATVAAGMRCAVEPYLNCARRARRRRSPASNCTITKQYCSGRGPRNGHPSDVARSGSGRGRGPKWNARSPS